MITCSKYFSNMKDIPKNNILMLENIRQKRLTILEHFDAYICYYYSPRFLVDRILTYFILATIFWLKKGPKNNPETEL